MGVVFQAQTHADDRWPTWILGCDEVRCRPEEHSAAAEDAKAWPLPIGRVRGPEMVVLLTMSADID